MSLTKPIIGSIKAFDSSTQKIIEFISQAGQQVIGNTLVIKNQLTGNTVFNDYTETFQYNHIIPANILTNGTSYQATIQTFGVDGVSSPVSDPVQFQCLSTPIINISNLPVSLIIQASNYNFIGDYYQAQGELLQYFEFNLYDNNGILLSTSGAVYSTDIQYTFYGLEDNTAYFIELIVNTVNGMTTSTGQILFNVDYIIPDFYTINQLENLCDTGQIQISSNIHVIVGSSNPSPPIYIDDKEVDLRKDGSWVRFEDGFSINNDFTLKLIGRDFKPNSKIIELSGNNGKLILNWVVDNFTFDEEKAFIELYCYNDDLTEFKYYIKSNYISTPNATEDVFVWLRRIDNLYDLRIENMGVVA